MRKAAIPLVTALSLALGLLSTAPATADHVVTIAFPDGLSEFYSPFAGPATITFSLDPSQPNDYYGLRLRTGGDTVYSNAEWVDAGDPSRVHTFEFTWPALSVGAPKAYEVAVFRDGALVTSESFGLRPRLATVTGAAPNPFFPWIDDGHKDTTRITYSLDAPADVQARVYGQNAAANCCGSLARSDDLGAMPEGTHHWTWDGRDGGGANLPKGNYFVRIRADDGPHAPATSKPFKIAIARTYRVLDTKSKPATAWHHRGPVTSFVIGGDCLANPLGGRLWIGCTGARVTVFWRWGLGPSERIEKASFVIYDPDRECRPPKASKGHSRHESSFTVSDPTGHTSCRIETARVTYSRPQAS